MKRTLVALSFALVAIFAVTMWQWSTVLSRLNLERWSLVPAESVPFLEYSLLPPIAASPLVGGVTHLETFVRMETGDSDTAPEVIRTRVFVPGHMWADVVFRDADGQLCAFRLSRSPGVPSGFLRWDGTTLESREDVVLGGDIVVSEEDLPADLRQELMIWSHNEPHHSIPALEREGNARWFEIEVRAADGGIEASVDGEVVGQWQAVSDIHGPVGVRAGDLPIINVDWFEVIGANGAVLMRDDFGPTPTGIKQGLALAVFSVFFWLVMWCVAMGLIRWLFPGARMAHTGNRLVRGMWLLSLLPLVGWWVGPIETKLDIFLWYLAGDLLAALLWLITLISIGDHFRWRVAPREKRAPGPLLRSKAALVFIAAPVVMLLSLVMLETNHPRVPSDDFQEDLLNGAESVIVEEGDHIRSPRASDRGDTNLSVQLTILEPGTLVELYILEDAHDLSSPTKGVRDWVALQISDDPSTSGLQVSDQPPRGATLDPAPIGMEISTAIQSWGSTVISGLDDSVSHDTVTHSFPSGYEGLVVRSGRAEITALTHTGMEPLAAWERGPIGQLRVWAHASPALFSVFAIAGLISAWALGSLLLAALGGFAAQPLLRWSAFAWAASLGVGFVLWGLLHFRPMPGWTTDLAVWVTLWLALLFHAIFWLLNSSRVRRQALVLLLFLIGLIALAEPALRATPLNYTLKGRAAPGYMRNLVSVASWEPEHVWMTYTGEYVFPESKGQGWERPVPLAKPEGVQRIFCMGGSSMWGAGVGALEETISGQIERILTERGLNVEAHDAGYPGYTIFDDLLMLKRDILRLSPDAIALYVGANDGYLSHLAGGGLEEQWSQQVALTGNEGRFRRWLTDQRAFVGLTRILGALRSFPSQLSVKVPTDRYEANLREFIEICQENDIALVIADEVLVEDLHIQNPSHAPYHEILARVADEMNVPLIDARSQFREHFDDGWMVDTVHPGAKGYLAIATDMADVLETELGQ